VEFSNKALSVPFPTYGLSVLLVFPACPVPDHLALVTFVDTSSTGSGHISECEEPCPISSSALSFPLTPTCPGTNSSWILLCSASFTKGLVAVPYQLGIYLETVKDLHGSMTLRRTVDVPVCSPFINSTLCGAPGSTTLYFCFPSVRGCTGTDPSFSH